MSGRWNKQRVKAFHSKGYLTNGGNRWIRRWDDVEVTFHKRRISDKDTNSWVATYRDTNEKVIKTIYDHVSNYASIVDDFYAIIKEKVGRDMEEAELEKFEEPQEPMIEIDIEDFTPKLIGQDMEATEMDTEMIPLEIDGSEPEVLIFEAPKPDDHYSPIIIDFDGDDNYQPIELEMEFGSPEEIINAELVAKVQEREFQPLNAYPHFPFGEVDLDDTRLGAKEWGEATGNTTGGPAEVVEVELLNDVRDKDGKHIVEKEEGFSAKPAKSPLPRVPALLAIGGIGILAYLLFFKNRIQ